MALSRNHNHLFLTFALTSIFLSSLAPSSGGMIRASPDEEELRKMVLGSRPPACVNRCMSCRPCEATLVIPPHRTTIKWEKSSHREDDSYYLLSWKCRCGNKLYQP
ncbi:EPIDERMAL PATTERNING FACTOR-like protein 6 [Salvia miltiorrhiza]|uniref:EPIDERMAL PATTERNING FACTOR-like protein 6 n=1 Tax=Salvia miltiorrhiza TaxID=226208 RepID=UPI0025AC6557|nr:EPIDERMAL PATTERNING FACTOR-like protein 6 [Salvia miltiorrhiza]